MSKVTGAGLGLGLVFIILKCIFFITDIQLYHYNLVVLANILCVMLAVGLGMYVARDKNNQLLRNGIDRIKAGIRGGAVYTIVISVFIFFYYNNIDKKFFETMKKERVEMAEKADFKTLQQQHPEKLKHKSHGDFIDMEREQAELWFSPFMISTLTLVGTLICAMIYSVIVNLIFKNLFFKPKF